MQTGKLVATLVLATAFTAIASHEAASTTCNRVGCSWLATGTVTKIEGDTFYLLGKDNVIYTVDAAGAELLWEFTTDSRSLRVGDIVRVYGTVSGAAAVTAARVRALSSGASPSEEAPKKEIKIIYERPREQAPAEGGGPSEVKPDEGKCEWQGRGLITDIDYTARQIKVRTSTGQFTIDANGAQLVHGSKLIAIGRLSLGDAVRIIGTYEGINEVNAKQVRVLRTRTESENALPQMPVAVAGVIQQIDYPSLTFKMWTETMPIVVMADQDTLVQQQQSKMTFKDLRAGMRIKMNGYGSPATGYAAKEILIIGISP